MTYSIGHAGLKHLKILKLQTSKFWNNIYESLHTAPNIPLNTLFKKKGNFIMLIIELVGTLKNYHLRVPKQILKFSVKVINVLLLILKFDVFDVSNSTNEGLLLGTSKYLSFLPGPNSKNY